MSDSPYQLKSDPHSSHAVILARLGDGHGRRALDVGAADGFLAELLTRQGWQVTALERDPAQAAKARGRCHEVIVADLDQAAPRLQGFFDAIVYGDVLEHLNDPLPVLVALDRALAAGGRVIVSVPNVAHLWGLSVEELVATPVPLLLVVPPRLHGPVLDAVHALSAGAARAWKGGLAYQFVAVCRRASAEPR